MSMKPPPPQTKRKPKQLALEKYESSLLRRELKPVADPTAPETQAIVEDMMFSIQMEQLKKPAAGMAANQWGIDQKIFLYCPDGSEKIENVTPFFNPSYEPMGTEESVAYEGCFSIPLAIQQVSRFEKIRVKYQDAAGQWFEKEMSGWEARVWQHENDHVLGTLCDAKGPRTVEKIQFKDDEDERAFFDGVRKNRKKQRGQED